ncbi:putative V-type proton ATPase 116 kDa subunit a [Frankliniella fusca]|uniref:V-type proton ATPase 116 kDa subunit a n=1 Tax=Frankliniella fusca TaxID=407009 RepID=A0AAE1HTJ3_9NEOP|nr:putative V-type proton ATPase 116 kDa subunit a [Frankliniella fusca]
MSFSDKSSKSRKFCSVFGCQRRGGGMFKYPSDQKSRIEWGNVCKLNRTASSTMYVCRRHFTSSDMYQTSKGLTRVCRGAKPSLYLPPESPQKMKAKQICVVLECETNRVEGLRTTLHSFPRCSALGKF